MDCLQKKYQNIEINKVVITGHASSPQVPWIILSGDANDIATVG